MSEKSSVVGVQTLLRRVIRNPEGKIVFDSGEEMSKSFVLSFLKHVWLIMNRPYGGAGADGAIHPDTGGINRTLESSVSIQQILSVTAPVNTSTYGLVVGTGSAAESNSDYALQTQIAHGVGAGQLSHGSCLTAEAIVIAGNVDLTLTRTFTNGSGGVITVNEIGAYVSSRDSAAVQRFFCLVRDVLAAGDAIPNGSTYTVVYTLRTTV